MRWRYLIAFLACYGGLMSGAVLAFSGADPIPSAYRTIALEAEIPPAILFVVALQESGAALTSGRVMPWPWTLNIAGAPRRFRTRTEAYYALCSAIQVGQQVDVGLGQINWNYNAGHLLNDPWLAFDPYFNLRVASRLLRFHFDAAGQRDWWVAVGNYHSPGLRSAQRDRAARYARQVKAHYQRLWGDSVPVVPSSQRLALPEMANRW
jgi:hypothetical protein